MNRIFSLLLIIVVLFPVQLVACLNAYQFKVFPVGMSGDTIITVDVQIWRSENIGSRDYKTIGDELDIAGVEMTWTLKANIAKYNKNQKLLNIQHLDSVFIVSDNYDKELQSLYNQGYNKILTDNEGLELFTPEYLIFGTYQDGCDGIYLEPAGLSYRSNYYTLPVLDFKNKDYYGIKNGYYPVYSKNRNDNEMKIAYPKLIERFGIGSVRKYSLNDTELIMAYVERGHELGMGWITDNPLDPRLKDGSKDFAIYMNEHKANFKFNDIRKATYEEPLMIHGFGFDMFFVADK